MSALPSTRPPTALIWACGLAVAIIPLVAGLIPGEEAARLERLIIGYGLAGLPYLYIARRWASLPDDRRTLMTMLTVAAAGRLVLLALPALLSEDLWRYLWDGAVQWAGINPYLHAPNSAAVDAVATTPELTTIRGRIGHAHIPTIYPPAAQLTFLGVTAFGASATALRLCFALADLGIALGLWRWAARLGGRPQAAALYAFAPLPMLESVVGAHVDVIGVLGLVWAGVWLSTRRGPLGAGLAGVGLAVGIGAKLLPLLALPTLLRRRPWAVVATGAAVVLMSLPYVSAGAELLDGLQAYGQRWRANDGVFALLMWPFQQIWPSGEQPVDLPLIAAEVVRRVVGAAPGAQPGEVWPDEVAFAAAKLTAGGLFGLVCLHRWWRARTLDEVLAPAMIALMLVSPVVHPWYLMWILPFAVLGLSRQAWWAPAVILWGLTAWIAYLPRPDYLRTGQWDQATGWVMLEYLPVWGALIIGWILHRRRSVAADASASAD